MQRAAIYTYDQILGFAMQLSTRDRFALCRDLSRGWRTADLRAIQDSVKDCDLTDEEIRQECELVRQQMYEERHTTV